ncbi:hypothetical protein HY605_02550 [Candidatus Peregrinibacteria bacterium]|nr:hypothetical protein [Candidatus Peregrinibacteria bacterium]
MSTKSITFKRFEDPPSGDFKVGITGIAGSVGTRLSASLRRVPGVTCVAGTDISSPNASVRGAILKSLGLERHEGESEPFETLFADCDLVVDARRRSKSIPEDLSGLKVPVLGQSVGSETSDTSDATRLLLPLVADKSDFMRVGDCNATALAALIGPLRGCVEDVDLVITMMTNSLPETHRYSDIAVLGVRGVARSKVQALYGELFGQHGIDVRLHGLHQVGGISCYLHEVTLHLSEGMNLADVVGRLKNAPHVAFYSDALGFSNNQNTYVVNERDDLCRKAGIEHPPVAVFSCVEEPNRTGPKRVRLMVGVLNKKIATAGNVDAINLLVQAKQASCIGTLEEVMKTTDRQMGWDEGREFLN